MRFSLHAGTAFFVLCRLILIYLCGGLAYTKVMRVYTYNLATSQLLKEPFYVKKPFNIKELFCFKEPFYVKEHFHVKEPFYLKEPFYINEPFYI